MKDTRKLHSAPIDEVDVELDRNWLVPLLNFTSPVVESEASGRVLGLLNDLLALSRIRSRLRQLGDPKQIQTDGGSQRRRSSEDPEDEAMIRDGKQLLDSVNLRLRRYRWHPLVFFGSKNDPGQYAFDSSPRTETEYQENVAVETFLDYFSEGKITWFRHCADCNLWFIAATEHQKYCCTKCRVRNHSGSDDFKRKRAGYMRLKYRPNLRAREEAAKQIAKKIRDGK
jgi:hypothetical protein